MTDSLILHQFEITRGFVPGNLRNMSEMAVTALHYSDYRRDKPLEALECLGSSMQGFLEDATEFEGYHNGTIFCNGSSLN